MAQSFTFSFSGDDIDVDEDDTEDGMDIEAANGIQLQDTREGKPAMTLFPAQKHSLADMLNTLPSSISFNTLRIPLLLPPPDQPKHPPALSPSITQNPSQRDHPPSSISIRRRALFDILLQLKAESDVHTYPTPTSSNAHLGEQTTPSTTSDLTSITDNADLISSLEGNLGGGHATDLQPGIYEGGFKTWECALDLASHVASFPAQDGADGASSLLGEHSRGEGGGGEGFDVVELGAGSAIPSLALLRSVLDRRRRGQNAQKGASSARHGAGRPVRFFLCDYNVQVLSLVSGANVLLQLCAAHHHCTWQQEAGYGDQGNKDGGRAEAEAEAEGEFNDINPARTTELLQTLRATGVDIEFISGTWGNGLVDLVSPPAPSPDKKASRPILILASETIYSRASTITFTETVLELLTRAAAGSVALIAAKKMYLGVGGSVDELVRGLEQGSRGGGRGGRGVKVDMVRDIRDEHGGVGRVVLRVRLGHSHQKGEGEEKKRKQRDR